MSVKERKDWRYYYYELGTARESRIKSDWKRKGLLDDPSDVYEIYKDATNCEICDIKLTEDPGYSVNKKVMNHCHETGYFNNILCWSCNIHEHYNTKKFNDVIQKNLTNVG